MVAVHRPGDIYVGSTGLACCAVVLVSLMLVRWRDGKLSLKLSQKVLILCNVLLFTNIMYLCYRAINKK